MQLAGAEETHSRSQRQPLAPGGNRRQRLRRRDYGGQNEQRSRHQLAQRPERTVGRCEHCHGREPYRATQQCACARHHVAHRRQRPAGHNRRRLLRPLHALHHLPGRHREFHHPQERRRDVQVRFARRFGRHPGDHEEGLWRAVSHLLRWQHRLRVEIQDHRHARPQRLHQHRHGEGTILQRRRLQHRLSGRGDAHGICAEPSHRFQRRRGEKQLPRFGGRDGPQDGGARQLLP